MKQVAGRGFENSERTKGLYVNVVKGKSIIGSRQNGNGSVPNVASVPVCEVEL